MPTIGNQGWFEYGGRLGFRVSKGWVADLFVNGTLGPAAGRQHHPWRRRAADQLLRGQHDLLGWAKRSVPTILSAFADGWWARHCRPLPTLRPTVLTYAADLPSYARRKHLDIELDHLHHGLHRALRRAALSEPPRNSIITFGTICQDTP